MSPVAQIFQKNEDSYLLSAQMHLELSRLLGCGFPSCMLDVIIGSVLP